MSDTYLVSGVLLAVAGVVLGGLNAATLTAFGVVISFFTSSGASAAYLTASEVFPLETRAPCIAFFSAVGTATGGISGPLTVDDTEDGDDDSESEGSSGGRSPVPTSI